MSETEPQTRPDLETSSACPFHPLPPPPAGDWPSGSGCGVWVPTVQAAASFPTGRSSHISGKKPFRFPRSQGIYQTKRKDLKIVLLNSR